MPDAPRIPDILLWSAIVWCFAITHTSADLLRELLADLVERLPMGLVRALTAHSPAGELADDLMRHVIVPLEGFTFLLALLVLLLPLAHSFRASRQLYAELPWRSLLVRATLCFVAVVCLVFPIQSGRIMAGSWGLPFAQMSIDPFAETAGLHNRRLLLPALAHYLQLRGLLLYSLFNLLSLWFLLLSLCVFFHRRSPWPHRAVRWLPVLSIATSSFVISQLHVFGLVDHVVFWLVLSMLSLPLSFQAQMSLVALSLMTHEASAFLLAPLLFFGLRRWSQRIQALSQLPLFAGIWLLSYGGDYAAMSRPDELEGLLFLADPVWGALGVIFSFKALWVLVPWALVLLLRGRQWYEALALVGVIAAVGCMVLFVRDVSRLSGYAFPAIMAAYATVLQRTQHSLRESRILTAVLLVNLLIPSYWVMIDPRAFNLIPGLYAWGCDLLRLAVD